MLLCLYVSSLNHSVQACVFYLVFVFAVQLAHLAVHQVLDGVDLSLHLLLGGLQLVLQFTDERLTAAAVQRSLQHTANINNTAHTTHTSLSILCGHRKALCWQNDRKGTKDSRLIQNVFKDFLHRIATCGMCIKMCILCV